MNEKWNKRFVELAVHIADWSKDPATKVGAVAVRPNKTIASIGFNGFPRGITDDDRLNDRQTKHRLVIHAELNVILNARESLEGYDLYTNLLPCDRCAPHVIQAGFKSVHTLPLPPDKEYWREAMEASEAIFKEAGIEVIYYEVV